MLEDNMPEGGETLSWTELKDWLKEIIWQAMVSRDMTRLLKLGFTEDEAKMLCAENPKLVNHFLKKCHNFVEVSLCVNINHKAMRNELRVHSHRVDTEQKQRQLVQCGAPFQMLKDAYKISNANYRYIKTLYDVEDSTGRIPSLSVADAKKVWFLWNKYLHLSLVDRYLQIHNETNIPIKALWTESRSWVKDKHKRVALEQDMRMTYMAHTSDDNGVIGSESAES
jgi:hypothetical protein